MSYTGNPDEYKGHIEELTTRDRNHAESFNKLFRQMVDNDEALNQRINDGLTNLSFISSEPTAGVFEKPGVFFFDNHSAGGYVGLVVTRSGIACKIEWEGDMFYGIGTKVHYLNRVYEATQDVTSNTPPTHISGAVNGWRYLGLKAEFKPFGYISK